MTAKYIAALLMMALVSLSASGADKLSVVFPGTTNLVFSVPINGKTGERPYDAFLEYPSEYEDGRPTKYGRTGLGYYIYIEVIEETEMGVQCKLKVDHHTLSGWNQYDIGNQIIAQQPVFSAFVTELNIILPIGQWFSPDNHMKYLYQREDNFQQSDGSSEEAQAQPDSIEWLIQTIRRLPSDEPVAIGHPGYNNYRTQKEHWLGWLDPASGTGTYPRSSAPDRDARYVYNHIVEPQMLLWLISASGVRQELVEAAAEAAEAASSLAGKSAAIRKQVTWPEVAAALLACELGAGCDTDSD